MSVLDLLLVKRIQLDGLNFVLLRIQKSVQTYIEYLFTYGRNDRL